MKFANPYNFRERGDDFATHNDKESLTVQSDAKGLDINVIMDRYSQSGQLPRINSAEPQYGDFSNVGDYRDCLERIETAKATFQALPATVRKRFANDPAQFLEFATDPNNIEELTKLGLTKPKEEPYSKDAAAIITALQETRNAGPENDDDDPSSTDGHRRKRNRPSGQGGT